MKDKIEEYRVQKNGMVVEMLVKKVSGVARYSMDVEYQNKIYKKRVGSNFYIENHVGEKILMKYLKDSDKVMYPDEDENLEFIAMFGLFILGIVCFLKGLGYFPKLS